MKAVQPSLRRFAPTVMLLALATLATPIAASDATADASTVAEITALVNEFIEGSDQAAQHARFWADDLVYTSSSAEVTSKAEIMKGFAEAAAAAEAPAPAEAAADPAAGKAADTAGGAPKAGFTAEDILVRPYGDAAAVTFRLVQHTGDGGRAYYRNSGMLLRRDGRWQVVTWQATKVPVPAPAE